VDIKAGYKTNKNMIFDYIPYISERDKGKIIPSTYVLTTEDFVIQSLRPFLPWAFQVEHPLRDVILTMQCF